LCTPALGDFFHSDLLEKQPAHLRKLISMDTTSAQEELVFRVTGPQSIER